MSSRFLATKGWTGSKNATTYLPSEHFWKCLGSLLRTTRLKCVASFLACFPKIRREYEHESQRSSPGTRDSTAAPQFGQLVLQIGSALATRSPPITPRIGQQSSALSSSPQQRRPGRDPSFGRRATRFSSLAVAPPKVLHKDSVLGGAPVHRRRRAIPSDAITIAYWRPNPHVPHASALSPAPPGVMQAVRGTLRPTFWSLHATVSHPGMR